MPSAAATRGSVKVTGFPSKVTLPLSMLWIPAMHFTRVDLPAPLSPTSAVTSPGYTARSTSRRTWTGPKLLLTPRISRIGSGTRTSLLIKVRTPHCKAMAGRMLSSGHRCRLQLRSVLLDAGAGAGRLDALTDLRHGQRACVDHVHDIGLGDDLR